MSSTNTHPRYSKFERHFAAAAADQRQQADIVAARVQASSSGSLSRDETTLLTARLSEIAVDQQHQEATEESSSQIQTDLINDNDFEIQSYGSIRSAAENAVQDQDPEILPVQDFPVYRRAASASTSPVRRRGEKVTYRDFLARQELPPPPPPPRPTRVEKWQQQARQNRIAEAAEKTETILKLKGIKNPTDEDLIAVISQLSDFKKKTTTYCKRRQDPSKKSASSGAPRGYPNPKKEG